MHPLTVAGARFLRGMVWQGGGSDHGGTHRLTHRVELVVTGDLLDQLPVRLLEQHEIAQVVQQQRRLEEAPDHGFQLKLQQRPVMLAAHRAPGHETLTVCGQRADARLQPVADHQRSVADEQVGDIVLVGLQLVVGRPDAGLFRGGVFQLQHRDGQAVDETHQVGPARLLAALHGELVDHQKAVALGLLEVDQAQAVAPLDALGIGDIDRDAVDQRFVHGAVALDQRGVVGLDHCMGGFVQRTGRHAWVQPGQRVGQFLPQHHLPPVGAGRGVAVGSDVGPAPEVPAGVLQPGDGLLLDVVFGHDLCLVNI